MNHHLFTPILKSRHEKTYRAKMLISPKDNAKITRGLGYKGIVTALFPDRYTGHKFKVYGYACGLPLCYCDALAVYK